MRVLRNLPILVPVTRVGRLRSQTWPTQATSQRSRGIGRSAPRSLLELCLLRSSTRFDAGLVNRLLRAHSVLSIVSANSATSC